MSAVEEALVIKEQINEAAIDQAKREKTSKIEEIVYKKLKSHLKQKYKNMKQNPNDILQRQVYQEKENPGRPYVNAVQIKIVSQNNLTFQLSSEMEDQDLQSNLL